MQKLLWFLPTLVAAQLAYAGQADASMIIARNATGIQLRVDAQGRAAVTLREGGRVRHIVAWGAVNAAPKFKLDYAGGWGTFRKQIWKTIRACGLYDGPPLAWLVAACKAPDGSYWALQSWQRMLPNLGYTPWKPSQKVWELHLSHWRGPLPVLEIHLDWVYRGKYDHLFGRYHYLGKPVHGFKSTSTGVPLDPYGRNVYLDTFNSAYGPGWKRENSFLAHRPNGNFCYGFYPHKSYYDRTTRPAGKGQRYRATAIGPGVAPDVFWTGDALGRFDPDLERRLNELADVIAVGDPLCSQH
jgi:hypothetical protein